MVWLQQKKGIYSKIEGWVRVQEQALSKADLRRLMFLIMYCVFLCWKQMPKEYPIGTGVVWLSISGPISDDSETDGNKTMSLSPPSLLKRCFPGSDHAELRSTLQPKAVSENSKPCSKDYLTLLIDWTRKWREGWEWALDSKENETINKWQNKFSYNNIFKISSFSIEATWKFDFMLEQSGTFSNTASKKYLCYFFLL